MSQTSANRSEAFGRLLSGAINSIATYEGRTAPAVEDELGQVLHLSGKTIQRYKAGHLPPEARAVEILAEAAVRRGYLGREWLGRFLQAARYPAADTLLNQLCPAASTRPRPPRVYHNLPAPTYSQFVMREQAFAEVLDGLSQRSAAVLVVGLGGNGKTSLAREVANRCLQDDAVTIRFDAAVWISDKDRPGTTNLSVVLDDIARTLDYPGFTQFAHDEKRYEVEQLLRRQRVLLVVDNFETITDGALLTWLLRLPEPSKALITSREKHRGLWSCWLAELRGMSATEAQMLIGQRLRMLQLDKLMKDSAELEPLLAVTGGNPKAIEVALGLVKHERRPLKFVIDDLHAARGELFDDLFTRAWALLDEAARRVLMVMTFFPTSASGEALAATADVQGYAFDRAVERLTDLALLDIQKAELSNPPRYTLHPLVRMFAKLKLMGQKLLDTEGRERWMRWYVELAEQVGTCSQDLQKLKLLDNESETAFHVVIWSSKNQHHSICLQMCKGIAYYFYVRGDWETYLKIMRIRSFSASRLGDITEELRSLARQAQVFAKQGNIDAAKKIILNVQDKIESGKTNRYIETLFYDAKALLYLCEKNYHMAIYFWKMLANDGSISKESFIASQQALGNCLFLHGNSKSAMEILLDALFQADSYNFERNSISIKIKMAKIHIKEGLLSEAENLLLSSYEKAVEIQERRYIAQSKLLYARLYALRCERPMARVSLTEAIDLFERLGMRGELAEARQDLARLEAGEMSVAVPEESLADTDEPAQF